MPVRSPGAPTISSATVSEYSNSTPNTSNESPTPNPRTGRLEGVALAPTKAVRSAAAGAAVHPNTANTDRVTRPRRMRLV